MTLCGLILRAAVETPTVGPLIETLKWRQQSYLPKKPSVGSVTRIGVSKTVPVRAMLIPFDKPVPEDEIRHCVSLALTHHL